MSKYLGWRPLLTLWALVMVVLALAIIDSQDQQARFDRADDEIQKLNDYNERMNNR